MAEPFVIPALRDKLAEIGSVTRSQQRSFSPGWLRSDHMVFDLKTPKLLIFIDLRRNRKRDLGNLYQY